MEKNKNNNSNLSHKMRIYDYTEKIKKLFKTIDNCILKVQKSCVPKKEKDG